MAITELTVRDWMVIIGVLLIVAVLLDAWRRVRSERYSRVTMNLADSEDEGDARDEELAWLKELPNGGARVVERGDLLRAAGRREPEPEPESELVAEAQPSQAAEEVVDAPEEEVPLMAGMAADDAIAEPENVDWLDDIAAQEPLVEPVAQEAPGVLPRDIDPEVFMLNVVARDPRGFRGEDILHILLACDLRFGDMNFFHRHEFEAGRGAIQFSVANMMQPGVFDIDNMADFNTPGLVFFLTLPGPEDMMKAFDYMLETAQAVSRNLGGDVLDESRSVLTKQTLEHCRQQIRDLERRMLARAR
ncbi:cell division protein ZipA [Halioglobus japonicus]|uniref:Cell division protein ZipA n=1 Tax=Halioglobus japonicus TaxID=930805 RepID=A0AAP8SNU8_9GAMM|nr:cell division protein ZipA [Halioglobus japonicus]AQA18818.1 cell division protein ZipA [Halioglobus japonicus]PLW86851.1 cell division protein ZipA [Halioglobus japonicus]GHD23725.1 cell division protein ZipA [Halioglobus japonicus]